MVRRLIIDLLIMTFVSAPTDYLNHKMLVRRLYSCKHEFPVMENGPFSSTHSSLLLFY